MLNDWLGRWLIGERIMGENELRELFVATNTEEPLAGGWPGLLRFGLAVAAAEREACARVCDVMANNGHEGGWSIAAAIRAL